MVVRRITEGVLKGWGEPITSCYIHFCSDGRRVGRDRGGVLIGCLIHRGMMEGEGGREDWKKC